VKVPAHAPIVFDDEDERHGQAPAARCQVTGTVATRLAEPLGCHALPSLVDELTSKKPKELAQTAQWADAPPP